MYRLVVSVSPTHQVSIELDVISDDINIFAYLCNQTSEDTGLDIEEHHQIYIEGKIMPIDAYHCLSIFLYVPKLVWQKQCLYTVPKFIQTGECFSSLRKVPRARLLGSPMIWQEWRAHNFIFVLRYLGIFSHPVVDRCIAADFVCPRHVLGFTICWGYLRYVNFSNHLASVLLDFSMFAVPCPRMLDLIILIVLLVIEQHCRK